MNLGRAQDDEAGRVAQQARPACRPRRPLPTKKSPRAGPTMAEPVSCAIISRRSGSAPLEGDGQLALEPEGRP